jgi:hypothetical protein
MYENPSAGKFDPPPGPAERDRRTVPSSGRLWLLPLAVVPLAVVFLMNRPGTGERGRMALGALWLAASVIRFATSRRQRENRAEDSRTHITR